MNQFLTRLRGNIKETAKGLIQRDVTVEFSNGEAIKIQDPLDVAKIENKSLAEKLLDTFEEIGREAESRGYKMVGKED